jgi:hypothetical protein
MNLADAAVEILRRHGAGRPMHYRKIAELALEAGLIVSKGLTPEASLNAAISSEIARLAKGGEPPTFVAYGRGLYGLASHRVASEIEDAIHRNNDDVRARLLQELMEMDPRAFEDLIGRLLTALEFVDVEVTSYSGDGGIDVRGTLAVGGVTNVRTAIQVKRWSNNVSGRTVRELRGGLSPHERGLIITTSKFTRDAQNEAEIADRTPISLVDGARLVSLLVEHEIGVVGTAARVLRLDAASLLDSDEDEATQTSADPSQATPATEPQEVTRALRRRSGRHPSGKNLSLWPLPGGRENFVATMSTVLAYVGDSEPTLDQFIDWMHSTFPRVNSKKTAKSYIEMVRLSGLIEPRGDRLTLTTDAATYLASNDPEDLLRTMCDNIAGLEETLERVRTVPSTPADLEVFLNELLGTSWSSQAQAGYRLQWLESFGKLEKRNGTYFVRDR